MGTRGIAIALFAIACGMGYMILRESTADFVMENPVVLPSGTASTEVVVADRSEEGKVTETAVVETSKPIAEEAAPPRKSDPLSGEAVPENAPAIRDRFVSFGHAQSSGRKIDTVVLHSSYNNQGGDRYSVDKVIDIWKSYDVAPHYMIDRKGMIYRLVEDEDIAYHAGNSKMPDGRTDVNKFSIGVEILGDEDDGYTGAQYDSVNALVAYLGKKHGVKYVVGHDDIASGRKTDPWNFDWKKLK